MLCGIARLSNFNDNDGNEYYPQKALIEKLGVN
jgi:hypothetical protein